MPRKEPQIFFTRRSQRLARLLVDPTYDLNEDLFGKSLELTLRQPMYMDDNGNSVVLRREATAPGQQTTSTVRGYPYCGSWKPLYGSADDFIALYEKRPDNSKGESLRDLLADVSSPLDELRQRIRLGLPGPSMDPEKRKKAEEVNDRIMDEMMEIKTPAMREHYFLTKESYKGATIVPFCEIKDYRVI